jgi:hypothetical protein
MAQLVTIHNFGGAASSSFSSASTGNNASSSMTSSGTTAGGDTSGTPSGATGNSGPQASTSTLPPNVAPALATIYQAYEQDPTGFTGVTSSTDGANLVVIQGDNVGIQVHDGNPADFNTLVTELQNAGMQITVADATHGLVVGMLPVAQLPTVAGLPQVPSVAALMYPIVK